MKGDIIADWTKVDPRNPTHIKKVLGAVQHFMQMPRDDKVQAAIQHFSQAGDFPANINPTLAKFMKEADYDNAFESVFDIRDMTGGQISGFDILDVESGLAFDKVLPGEKARVYEMAGAKVSVGFADYGGALGWLNSWMRDGQYWNLEDTAKAFRNKAYSKRASAFYDLLAAIAASGDLAWQAVTPAGVANTNENYDAIKDMNTINKACETIITNMSAAGYPIPLTQQFLVLYPYQLMGRINRAFGVLNAGISGAFAGIQYNIGARVSVMLTTQAGAALTDKYYVCLPKRKLKGGDRQFLTILGPQEDILANAQTVAGWMAFGGAIGDTNQVVRCKTAA